MNYEPTDRLDTCTLVWDGRNPPHVPAAMGTPRGDQLRGSFRDNLIELAGRVCYDDQTEVLTPSGWVKFSALERGVEVATYNRASGEMEFQEPTDYVTKRFVGKMYCLENTKVSLRVTEDHDLWAMPNCGDHSWQFIKASDVVGTRYSLQRHAAYAGVPCEGLTLPVHKYTQKTTRVGGGISTRVTPGLVVGPAKMSAWARFLGYYFSEGTVSKANGTGRRITIYQLPETAAPIIETIRELGFTPRVHVDKRNGVLHIKFGNGPIARYLDAYGQVAAQKRLPRECLAWPAAMRASLLDALMHGDGGVTAYGTRVYNTRSERLANDVQELIVKSGRVGTISYTPVGDMYRVRESAHDLHTANRHHQQDKLEDADETVYCVTVPNRILVVRRNRKVVLCGNCYDSLGSKSSRNTTDYHEHINQTLHHSTHEHSNFTIEIVFSGPNYPRLLEALANRKGLWIEQCEPEESQSTDAYARGKIRVTMNPRTVRDWERGGIPGVSQINPFSIALGMNLAGHAAALHPKACGDLAERAGDGVTCVTTRVVEPVTDHEVWATLHFENVSRGLSHELVRHGDETGISQRCLAGDTLVKCVQMLRGRVGGPKKGKKPRTLEQLYRMSQDDRLRSQLLRIRPRVLDESTGLFTAGKILDVVHSGKKPCFTLTTKTGKKLTCTADHKLYTNKGWLTLSDAASPVLVKNAVSWNKDSGVLLAENGLTVAGKGLYRDPVWLKMRFHDERRSLAEMAAESDCSTHVIRTWLRRHGLSMPRNEINRGRKPWNKGISYTTTKEYSPEAIERYRQSKLGDKNPMWKGGTGSPERRLFQAWKKANKKRIFARDGWKCLMCHKAAKDVPCPCPRMKQRKLELHHILPLWNRPDLVCEESNLATVCWECQLKVNTRELEYVEFFQKAIAADNKYTPSATPRPRSKVRQCKPHYEPIVAIEYAGEIDTYDLVLEGPNHGFIGNGIVVHNSTRFVAESESGWVPHPLILRRPELLKEFNAFSETGKAIYDKFAKQLEAELKADPATAETARKQARGAARGLLGNALETQLIFSASIHQWKHMLRSRTSVQADQEIRLAFDNAYEILSETYPDRFADWVRIPCEDGIGYEASGS